MSFKRARRIGVVVIGGLAGGAIAYATARFIIGARNQAQRKQWLDGEPASSHYLDAATWSDRQPTPEELELIQHVEKFGWPVHEARFGTSSPFLGDKGGVYLVFNVKGREVCIEFTSTGNRTGHYIAAINGEPPADGVRVIVNITHANFLADYRDGFWR